MKPASYEIYWKVFDCASCLLHDNHMSEINGKQSNINHEEAQAADCERCGIHNLHKKIQSCKKQLNY